MQRDACQLGAQRIVQLVGNAGLLFFDLAGQQYLVAVAGGFQVFG